MDGRIEQQVVTVSPPHSIVLIAGSVSVFVCGRSRSRGAHVRHEFRLELIRLPSSWLVSAARGATKQNPSHGRLPRAITRALISVSPWCFCSSPTKAIAPCWFASKPYFSMTEPTSCVARGIIIMKNLPKSPTHSCCTAVTREAFSGASKMSHASFAAAAHTRWVDDMSSGMHRQELTGTPHAAAWRRHTAAGKPLQRGGQTRLTARLVY